LRLSLVDTASHAWNTRVSPVRHSKHAVATLIGRVRRWLS
jgi:hypothetical protein